MGLDRFQHTVDAVPELESLIGLPPELVIKKQLSELDEHMQSFIAQSPFALLGTVGQDGRCDVSPRGDLPSVAKVLDSKTLIIGDRYGNRRVDSLRNIVATGQVGLLFMIPGFGETLRVNGRACVARDDDVLDSLVVQGKRPVVAIGVEINECYLQCAKAVFRSKIWGEKATSCAAKLPSFAKMLIDQTHIDDETVESLQEQIDESYAKRLY